MIPRHLGEIRRASGHNELRYIRIVEDMRREQSYSQHTTVPIWTEEGKGANLESVLPLEICSTGVPAGQFAITEKSVAPSPWPLVLGPSMVPCRG